MNREKLQKYIFILLLILLPTQLGRHFWPAWSYVSGVRVDYLSPTLYLTDILVFALFFLWLAGEAVKRKGFVLSIMYYGHKRIGLLILLTLLILLNVAFSLSPAVSIYKWLKVAELGFLIWWVAKNSNLLTRLPTVLLIPVLYESILAIWQFWQQSSIGGFWYLLGERTFNTGTPGIAQANIDGQLWLRPYGTLPHPNVLAGFLIVSLLIILQKLPHISRKITVAILVFGIIGLVLTLSRTSLMGFARTEPDSWSGRWQLAKTALLKWAGSPVLGTGLGTAPLYSAKVTNYALAFQPPHNIYLLVLAETGILGVLGILGILRKIRLTLPLAAVLVLGLFDHYFLTLQQGQLILALILGLSLGARQKQGKLLA